VKHHVSLLFVGKDRVEILVATKSRWTESIVAEALGPVEYRMVLTRLVGDPVRALAENSDLALVCLDLVASDVGHVALLASNRRGVPIVVLGEEYEATRVVSAIRDGAKSYVSKADVEHVLPSSVRATLRGETWLPPTACEAIRAWLIGLPCLPGPSQLTDRLHMLSRREHRVIELLAQGYVRVPISV
jgi:DNA-binding NarL/FixJ family response regulator